MKQLRSLTLMIQVFNPLKGWNVEGRNAEVTEATGVRKLPRVRAHNNGAGTHTQGGRPGASPRTTSPEASRQYTMKEQGILPNGVAIRLRLEAEVLIPLGLPPRWHRAHPRE